MTLERAYRRLLACYPWEHRRRYEREMLGVLLDDAAPGQRHPRPREVSDLLRGAAQTRIRYAVTAFSDRRWRDAAAVLGLLAPLALLAYTARPVLFDLSLRLTAGDWYDAGRMLQWHSGPRAIAWAMVVILALAGARKMTAACAWTAAALEGVRALGDYTGLLDTLGAAEGHGSFFSRHGYFSVHALWPVILAMVAAAALTLTSGRVGARPIGRGRVVLLCGAALLGAGAPTIDFVAYGNFALLGGSGQGPHTVWIFTRSVNYVEALSLLAGLALGLCVVFSTPAPLRRRVLALLAPVAATLLLTRVGFTDVGLLTGPLGAPGGFLPTQWLALALTPPLTLVLAVTLVHRREMTLRLLALGRAADRRANAVPPVTRRRADSPRDRHTL